MENNSTTQTLTQDEIFQMKKFQEITQDLITKFGQIEFQLQLLNFQKNSLIEELNATRLNEAKFFDKIKDTYGDINLNINTGEYSKI